MVPPTKRPSGVRGFFSALHWRPLTLPLLLLPLAACSPLQPVSDEHDYDEPVVEELVFDAVNLGRRRISGLGMLYPGDDNQGLDEPEPVVPTVAMTANHVVEASINDYLQNRQSVLQVWIERSHTYFPMIEQIFAEEGIPDELKYIALGESNLSPTIKSWAGAAGMWQFMPATGRGMGLVINDYVDERLDPEKSTRAAARHLKELYESYGQSWHLALAGYNCSYRCITRAVSLAGGSLEDPPSFWEIYPYLPHETRGFIPKFIAAALIVSNPSLYGISGDSFGAEISYDLVDIDGSLPLETAASLAGTSLAVLKTLNPELLTPNLPPQDSPYRLKIPAGSHDRFVRAFARLPEPERSVPAEYTVQQGDTLGAIARAHNTTVSALQTVNGIDGHLIGVGQVLRLPGVVDHGRPVSITSREAMTVEYGPHRFQPIQLTEEFQLVEAEGSTTDNPVVLVALSEEARDEDILVVPTIYRVQRGDTLGQIAEKHRVSVRSLQQWNNISGTLIHPGQELTINNTSETMPVRSYEVRRGDNLQAIARRFGLSVERLKQRNGLTSDLIYPGQSLQVN